MHATSAALWRAASPLLAGWPRPRQASWLAEAGRGPRRADPRRLPRASTGAGLACSAPLWPTLGARRCPGHPLGRWSGGARLVASRRARRYRRSLGASTPAWSQWPILRLTALAGPTLPGQATSPLGARPVPRVLELAASEAADLGSQPSTIPSTRHAACQFVSLMRSRLLPGSQQGRGQPGTKRGRGE
eukprot:scaffold385_cov53-Phaeocystis_antarctica.AAC.1